MSLYYFHYCASNTRRRSVSALLSQVSALTLSLRVGPSRGAHGNYSENSTLSAVRPKTKARYNLAIAAGAMFAGASFLIGATPLAQAQQTIPAGTNIGAYLNTNLSAINNNFVLGGNATWNTAVALGVAGHSTLTLNGAGHTVNTGIGNYLYYNNSVNNSVTLSNINFTNSAYTGVTLLFYEAYNTTSNLFLNDVTFNGVNGEYGILYMSGVAGTTLNVTAGGTNGATFSNTFAYGDNGGAMTFFTGTANLYGTFNFTGNSALNYGGAISIRQNPSNVTFNGTVNFTGNRARNYFGGAIDVWGGASTLTFNGVTTFTGNYVQSSATGAGAPRGGAINIGYLDPGAGNASIVRFTNAVTFDGNYVVATSTETARGGAISAFGNGGSYNYQYIFTGPAIFKNNYVTSTGGQGLGGAVFYDASGALLSLASGTQFLNNYAKTYGGAIYLQSGTITLNASTDNITFQGNKHGVTFDSSNRPVTTTGTPNAIYLGSSGNLNLIASAGQSINFHDPIASVAGSTITVTKTGAGDAIFYGDNGATTTYDSNIQANTSVQAGFFTLANSVNYGSTAAGNFSVNGTGTVRGGNNSQLRAATVTIASGGTVAGTGGVFTLASPSITVQADGGFGGLGTLSSTSNIKLNGIALGKITAGNTLTITSILQNDGAISGGLNMQGAGTLVLSAVNTYTGATTVSAGTLAGGVANTIASSGSLAVASGATFNLNGFAQTVSNLSGGGTVFLNNANLTINESSNTTFSGVFTDIASSTHTITNRVQVR